MADCSGAYLHQGLLQSPKKKYWLPQWSQRWKAVRGANGHVAMDPQEYLRRWRDISTFVTNKSSKLIAEQVCRLQIRHGFTQFLQGEFGSCDP